METDEDDIKGAAFEEFGEVLDSFNPVKGLHLLLSQHLKEQLLFKKLEV